MVLVMKPPSGAGALLRKNGLQEKRATKATLSSLLLSSRRAVNWRNSQARQGTFRNTRPRQRSSNKCGCDPPRRVSSSAHGVKPIHTVHEARHSEPRQEVVRGRPGPGRLVLDLLRPLCPDRPATAQVVVARSARAAAPASA